MGPGWIVLFAATTSAAILYAACGSRDPNGTGGNASSADRATSAGQFMSDGANICGNEFHDAQTQYPLLYFAIDRSGSMSELDGGVTRWEKVRAGVVDMVESLSNVVSVGAALFPAPQGSVCSAGVEVYAPKAKPGQGFASAIDVGPNGGTPIAATIQALRPILAAQPAPKVLLLATDGGPNCNSGVSCTAAECVPNMAGDCPASVGNCCAPPDGVVENCLDRVATLQAITAMKDEGTNVYVIGVPGSEPFATVLNQMALSGGAPQEGASWFYYRVDDLSQLSEVFKGIARDLISCTFELSDPPAQMGLTNVYLDGQVVPLDPANGWIWVDADTIELVGAACEELKSGAVAEVQVVSGCPTETPQ